MISIVTHASMDKAFSCVCPSVHALKETGLSCQYQSVEIWYTVGLRMK